MSSFSKTVALIFLAITFQSTTCIHRCIFTVYLKDFTSAEDLMLAQKCFQEKYWVIATFLGRVIGFFVLSNYAIRVGFFKTIKLASGLCVFISLAFLLVFYTPNLYEATYTAYVLRFLYCFLQPALHILPCIYLFKNSPKNSYVMISACFMICLYMGILLSSRLKNVMMQDFELFCLIPVITSCIAWGLYAYVQKKSERAKDHIIEKASISTNIKILSLFLGAASAAAVLFNPIYLRKCLLDVIVVDSTFQLGGILYYSLFLLMLMPAAKLTEKFGYYKIILWSLFSILILVLIPSSICRNFGFYFVHQILFSSLSAIFISPQFALLYKLFPKNSYHQFLYYVLGYNLCTCLAFLESKIAHKYMLHGGWCVYATSIGLCIAALYKFRKYLKI